MKTLFHVASLVVVFAGTASAEPYISTNERLSDAPRESSEQWARIRRVRAYMDSIVFPEVALSNVPIRDAVAWVTRHTPEHAKASVPVDRRGISTVARNREPERERVTVSLHSATLPQVLDAICAQHNYVWRVDPFALTIDPEERKN
jgi:hypothetical protein